MTNPTPVLVGTFEIDVISDATDDFGKLVSMLAIVSLILLQLLMTFTYAKDAELGVMLTAGKLPVVSEFSRTIELNSRVI